MTEQQGSSTSAEVGQQSSFAVLNAETHARFDPDTSQGTLDHALHMARYEWVLGTVCRSGDYVVDLGCGNGYGSIMIQNHGCRVVGVDLDPSVVTKNTPTSNDTLRFMFADATQPRLDETLGVSGADVVVAMETIEHLEDYFTFIENTIRLLHPNGAVVIGTPNRTMTYERYPRRRHMDPSHVQEFTPLALRTTLEHYFESVVLYFEYLPGYWTESKVPAKVDSQLKVRALVRRIAKALTPPILIAVARALRRRVSRSPRRAVKSSYSTSDVTITDVASNQLERDAFALIALCRSPKGPRA